MVERKLGDLYCEETFSDLFFFYLGGGQGVIGCTGSRKEMGTRMDTERLVSLGAPGSCSSPSAQKNWTLAGYLLEPKTGPWQEPKKERDIEAQLLPPPS